MTAADFDTLCMPHYSRVLAFCKSRYFGGEAADAEDLAQRTYLKAWQAWERYEPARGTIGGWLLTIALRLLANQYRNDCRRRQHLVNVDWTDETEAPILAHDARIHERAEVSEVLDAVRAAVRRLTPCERSALALAAAGKPRTDTQKTSLHRARVRLRQEVVR